MKSMEVNTYVEKKGTGTSGCHGLMIAETNNTARVHVQRYLLLHSSGDKLSE